MYDHDDFDKYDDDGDNDNEDSKDIHNKDNHDKDKTKFYIIFLSICFFVEDFLKFICLLLYHSTQIFLHKKLQSFYFFK